MTDVRLHLAENEAAAAEEVTQRLIAYNSAHAPNTPAAPEAERPLHVFAYAATGELIAGLVGRTHAIPFWCEISILWVDECYRRQGIGRRLMEQAEQEARRRGCRYARLSTSDYQAPNFYPRLGYTAYGHLADCPPGETVTYYWKPLLEWPMELGG